MKQLPVAPFAAAYKNRYINKEKMHNPITLIVKDRRGNTLDLFDLIPAAAPRHIDAVPGAYYQFCDDTTGIAPPSLHAARYGDALHVSFGGTAALVIEQYFSRGQGALSACRKTAACSVTRSISRRKLRMRQRLNRNRRRNTVRT